MELSYEADFNKKKGITPDTTGVDFYLIEGFLSEEVMADFCSVEREFLVKCYSKLQTFEVRTWYGNDKIVDCGPLELVPRRIFAYMLNGAKSGDTDCLEMLRKLYRTYYKQEYNQLKRYHRVHLKDVIEFATDQNGNQNLKIIGRVMGMCSLLKIEIDEDAWMLYEMLGDARRKLLELEGEIEDPSASERDKKKEESLEESFNDSIFEACVEQVSRWIEESGADRSDKNYQVYWEDDRFIEKCLEEMGYPDDYVYRCGGHEYNIPVRMASVLTILKIRFPEKNFSFEEVQHYVQMYSLVSSLVDVSVSFEEGLGNLLGEQPESFEEETEPVDAAEHFEMMDERIAASVSEKTGETAEEAIEGQVNEAEYLDAISRLRKRLNRQEKKNRYLRELYRNAQAELMQVEHSFVRQQSEREELIALREFVYRMEQEDQPDQEAGLAEMKNVIKDKKLVIIGGHVNWISKLAQQFPKWMFVHPDASQLVDERQLEGKDYVFFFTDYLSHSSYYKYISVLRRKRIPFGYLRGVNLESTVRQIYQKFI